MLGRGDHGDVDSIAREAKEGKWRMETFRVRTLVVVTGEAAHEGATAAEKHVGHARQASFCGPGIVFEVYDVASRSADGGAGGRSWEELRRLAEGADVVHVIGGAARRELLEGVFGGGGWPLVISWGSGDGEVKSVEAAAVCRYADVDEECAGGVCKWGGRNGGEGKIVDCTGERYCDVLREVGSVRFWRGGQGGMEVGP